MVLEIDYGQLPWRIAKLVDNATWYADHKLRYRCSYGVPDVVDTDANLADMWRYSRKGTRYEGSIEWRYWDWDDPKQHMMRDADGMAYNGEPFTWCNRHTFNHLLDGRSRLDNSYNSLLPYKVCGHCINALRRHSPVWVNESLVLKKYKDVFLEVAKLQTSATYIAFIGVAVENNTYVMKLLREFDSPDKLVFVIKIWPFWVRR